MTDPQIEGPDFSEAWDRFGRLLCEQFEATLRHKINVPQLRSAKVEKLIGALASAQKNFATIQKNREVTVRSDRGDYKFKYATLDGILSATVPALAEQGLALVQVIVHDDNGQPGLETTLYHSSGEWLRSITPMFLSGRRTKDGRDLPPSNQELGSAQSYARRYGISALLCVAADEDDDGNIADGNHVGDMRTPYKSGVPGTSGAGTDFRPAGRRPTGNMAAEAERDGTLDTTRAKGSLTPPKGKPTPAEKALDWTDKAIETLNLSAQTVESLGKYWTDNADKIGWLEANAAEQHERLLIAFDNARDAAKAKVSA